MSKINIPERLAARLSHEDKGRTWLAPVLQFKANIESILAKDPDFFPDYTLHGVPHLNRVLELASQLISTDTLSADPHPDKKDLLTPRDVAFLVCGILLHDMGMYLRPDGLKKLIKQEKTEDAFGGKPWNQEWSDYVDRTKRLSQEKMRYHFGRVIPVTADCVDHADTDDNKRIIGEFLRQHHARLAHEFSIGVLPGSTDTDLFANTGLMKKDRMMIGLLARSHGMAIRDTEEFLKTKFDNTVKPYNLPVFYLMAVLRIADYLDADGQRAPKQLTQQQKISVPLSAEEWTWNQCINADATYFHLEHKNYHVEAEPETSPQYVQLEKWLKSVQTDLDLCWSILAEKYPDDKNRYRLSIHRVVSNIHQPDHVKELNNTFLTKEAKISANPEIIKLMMEPLYGDDPTFGVRELLQNAVDACLERKNWEEKHDNPNYEGLVDIRIEGDTFTITDNGMGMNEDVLLNYYLSAGASYRSSEAWMAANAPDGESQVARTGKFGVGFLASFLLGDKIEVHTQHLYDRKGYCFIFSQDAQPLDIRRKERTNPFLKKTDPTGTTITIKLKSTAIRAFNSNSYKYPWYNWYVFDEPKIRYFMNNSKLQHQKLSFSHPPSNDSDWLVLSTEKFETYLWKPNIDNDTPQFYCNGIRIYDGLPRDLEEFGLRVFLPQISVIDKMGHLDVTLSRRKLKSIPAYEALYKEVFRWHIARLLLTPWDTSEECRHNCALGFLLRQGYRSRIPFLLSSNGFSLNHASVLSALRLQGYVILYYDGNDVQSAMQIARIFLKNAPCTIVASDLIEEQSRTTFFDRYPRYAGPVRFVTDLMNSRAELLHSANISYEINNLAASVWLRSSVLLSIPDQSRNNINIHKNSLTDSVLTGFWHGRPSTMPIHPEYYQDNMFPVAIHVPLDYKKGEFYRHAHSLFIQTLVELLGTNLWIPYDVAERKKKFPKAFEELKVYMEYINNHPIE